MSPRARSVISPPLPSRAKPKTEAPAAPREVKGWRSRPTRPGFSGVIERPFYGTEDEVRARAEVDALAGAAPVVECLIGSLYGRPPREVPTVRELAEQGMAKEVTRTFRRPDGSTGSDTRWEITPLGYDVLTDAMLGRDE